MIAAGVFAFLAIIGVYPRLIGKTGTKRHIILYETVLIIGGVIGNYTDLWGQPMRLGIGTQAVLTVFGLAVGIFVGCLVMSLAETLKALPAISRRIHLAIGLPYVILAIGLGKMTGSLIYFARRFGG